MCVREKKNKVVQIRISESDKKMIEDIYKKDGSFNLSDFLRRSIKELHDKEFNGIGSFIVS